MLVRMNHFASRNSIAKFVHNFKGHVYLPYREIYGVNFVIFWGFSFKFTVGNWQESYVGIYIYMYRIFRGFRLAVQDLIPTVVMSPKYYVRKALTVTKLCLFTANGVKQKRKYSNVHYSLCTYIVSKYGWVPNSWKHILSSEYNSYWTGNIPCILLNGNIHGNIQNSPQLVPFLNQKNSVSSRSYPTFLRLSLTLFHLRLGPPSGPFP
jgi:hypothetical protein